MKNTEHLVDLPGYEIPLVRAHRLKCGALQQISAANSMINKIKPAADMQYLIAGKCFLVISDWLDSRRSAQALVNNIKRSTGIYCRWQGD